jgi:TAG lipase/lysophosphatidylethanolamine acyltransferase
MNRRVIDESKDYDWADLRHQMREIERYRANEDILSLCGLLRSHPVRNICRILSPSLYSSARAGTKYLIEDWVDQLRNAISSLAALGSSDAPFPKGGFDSQTKTELFHDTRQTLGRSTLVLQGGSAFSMCHIGVVKALYLRGLLPKIITGTATGALIAALVGVHPDTSLLDVLKGNGINLSAFEHARVRRKIRRRSSPGSLSTFRRRVKRFLQTGHFFDIAVLEECARENLGDITFEEAHIKTGRILNITVALPDEIGVPQLLNYVTAPDVLIWSAVVASTATSKTLYAPVRLLCKDDGGRVRPYFACDSRSEDGTLAIRNGRAQLREAPLKRIGELFNVNHFIVSQARPYLIPFVQARRFHAGILGLAAGLLRGASDEVFHWLKQINTMGYLPTPLGRLLMDETIPSASEWAKISLTPTLSFRDLFRLFDIPTQASLDQWILRGERSVWPAVCELTVRCGIEFELDASYESVRRRLPDPVQRASYQT